MKFMTALHVQFWNWIRSLHQPLVTISQLQLYRLRSYLTFYLLFEIWFICFEFRTQGVKDKATKNKFMQFLEFCVFYACHCTVTMLTTIKSSAYIALIRRRRGFYSRATVHIVNLLQCIKLRTQLYMHGGRYKSSAINLTKKKNENKRKKEKLHNSKREKMLWIWIWIWIWRESWQILNIVK